MTNEGKKVGILTLILFFIGDIHVDDWKTDEQNTNWFAASVFKKNGGWNKMPRESNQSETTPQAVSFWCMHQSSCYFI